MTSTRIPYSWQGWWPMAAARMDSALPLPFPMSLAVVALHWGNTALGHLIRDGSGGPINFMGWTAPMIRPIIGMSCSTPIPRYPKARQILCLFVIAGDVLWWLLVF